MATNATQEAWLNSAPGSYFNPDGAYGFQCVDVADAYAEAIFGLPWTQCFGGGNAVQHYPKDNGYWTSIPNIDGDLSSVPQRGDVIIWGGDGFNPYGHIAVVASADAYSVTVIQQNGDGTASRPAELATLGYNQAGTGPCVGWLRPNLGLSEPAQLAANQRVAGSTINQRSEPRTTAAVVRQIPAGSLEVWDGWVHGETVNAGGMSSDQWLYDGIGYASVLFFDPTNVDGLPELAAPAEELPAGHRRGTGSKLNQRSEPRTGAPVVREIPPNSLEVFTGYVHGELVDLGGGVMSDIWYCDDVGYVSALFFDPAPERGDLPDLTAQRTQEVPAKHRRTGQSPVNQRREPRLDSEIVRTIPAGSLEIFDGFVHGERVDVGGGVVSDLWYKDSAGYASALFFDPEPARGDLPDLTEQVPPAPEPAPAPAPATDRLRGIDISMHQGDLDIAATGAEFAIVKATEGVGYADPKFARNVEATAGMPRGFYHFARPVGPENSPEAEAEWFLSVVEPHLDDNTVLALDWEAEHQENTAWALRWLEIVRERTGRTPLFYTYLNAVKSYDWSAVRAAGFPLWLAYYPTTAEQGWGTSAARPETGWNTPIWQYSSSGRLPGYGGKLDLDVFYGTREDWHALAAPASTPAPEQPEQQPEQPAPAQPADVDRDALRAALLDFAEWAIDKYLNERES